LIDETQVFALACLEDDAPPPVLKGVVAEGRLDGVLFELTLRQTYRNSSDRLLEVVYTFPLPPQAALLAFSSELNGERKSGAIVAKAEAEQQYEEALAEGDAPVMLEALDDGLHTANVGNLKPGDEIVLEVRFAQLLAFEQGRLRLSIPTTIAPRYGNAEQAGLQPQQVPHASIEAEYPLALSVTVAGPLASGDVQCPTHSCTREASDDGLRLVLKTGASLDRDVVIVVTPREDMPSLVIQGQDTLSPTAPVVRMAALQPRRPALRKRIALKLLVDCSGSMAGDSIASARVALAGALTQVGKDDRLSLSRFGSHVEHLQAPAAGTSELLQLLQRTVAGIEADLGGTEMEAALAAAFALSTEAQDGGADVLLITDGEIWQAEEMITAARASGHRVFAIGVGSSPAEGVLRSLAEATGGACEFATPGEALEAAARRMLARIRQQPWREARIDWGGQPAWQTTLPASVFGGDTVVAFAGMAVSSAISSVRLLAMDPNGATTEIARGEADAPAPGDSLPRMAAMRRMMAAGKSEALQLAVTYQLLGDQTNCVLVHQRSEADRATQQAELHRVSSMLAAGWGATGIANGLSLCAMESTHGFSLPQARCSQLVRGSYASDLLLIAEEPIETPLSELVLSIFSHLNGSGDVAGLTAHCASLRLNQEVRRALDEATDIAGGDGPALLLLAHWASSASRGKGRLSRPPALEALVDALEKDSVSACLELFERLLGAGSPFAGRVSRSERLQKALESAGSSDDAVT
jgi:Ca-activated chloride channel homolog